MTRPSVPCPSPNNLPPLTFHQVHGDHVRISHERRIAKRVESFCKGIAFSARPVRVNERVCVKFSEISNNWSGVIRFGFTTVDPATLRHNLPKYACPDLANKAGFWIKALNETYCERGNILYYYVTASGNVHFGINGEEKDVFMTGIETRTPLWTIIDIYGNCTAIEFLDYRTNSRSSEMNSALSSGSLCRQPSYPPQGQCQQQMINAGPHRPIMMRNPINGSLDTDVDRIVPAFQSMSVQNAQNSTESNLHFPPVRYLPYGSLTQLVPMPFHRTKGRNVYISQNRCIASRNDNEFCQGYVFTGRPLRIGETLIIQILRTDSIYLGALAIGLTSCDPSTLSPLDLPDDSELLLDRPEYWVVSKDAASAPNTGDEIAFCVTRTGEVTIRKNGGPPTTVMHVDQSLELYAFLDVYGSTQSVRVMSQAPLAHSSQYLPASQLSLNSATSSVGLNTSGSTNLSGQGGVRMPQSPQRLQVQMPGADSMTSLASQMEVRSNNYMPPPCQMSQNNVNNRVANANNNANLVQLQSRGAVLVVNLPPDVLTTASQQMASPRVTTMTANAATISVPASANLIEVSLGKEEKLILNY